MAVAFLPRSTIRPRGRLLRSINCSRRPPSAATAKAVARGGDVLLCGTCLDARGIGDAKLIEGTRRSTMDALAEATLAADRALVF
ncbi:DsrE family protein [Thiocapsa sp. C3-3m]|uniref:DsrE family protein n=1 Tax=Thiocapsa sp. C3-3m TaxID=3137394 RepID=UPI0035B3D9F1